MNYYNFTDYRDLLLALLEKKGRGSKVQLAHELNCQPGHISQVLNKNKVHFSPENMVRISQFLNLDFSQEDYLLNLFYKERAASHELKEYFQKKIVVLQNENLSFEKQLKRTDRLDEVSKSIYYSHWAYCCIHMIVSIPEFNTLAKICDRLNIGKEFALKVLNFLTEKGLITESDGHYSVGEVRIHLKKDSPLVRSHHQNFRYKALASLERESSFDLHYSSVMTLSKKDAIKIRDLILELTKKKDEILIPSPNEEIICFNLDFFKVL